MSDTELLPKSKPEPVRRLELFTGSGCRVAVNRETRHDDAVHEQLIRDKSRSSVSDLLVI